MAALRGVDVRPFVVELIDHVRKHFEAEVRDLEDWDLGEEIEQCLHRALDYGLEQRRDLARFAAVAACLGWSFDTQLGWPAVQLRDTRISPSDRMARVYERCLRELEERAAKASLEGRLGR